MKRINLISILIILIFIGFLSCSRYRNKKMILIVKSSEIPCGDEHNVHLEVIKTIKGKDSPGNYILPICDTEKCKELIYEIGYFDTTSIFRVTGYLSKKGHDRFEYGCSGSYRFKIIKCGKIDSTWNKKVSN